MASSLVELCLRKVDFGVGVGADLGGMNSAQKASSTPVKLFLFSAILKLTKSKKSFLFVFIYDQNKKSQYINMI